MSVEAKVVAVIACQQVLQEEGSVYSIQWLDLPTESPRVSGSFLLESYFRFIRESSFSLIRAVAGEDGIQFRLLGVPLLRFMPPQQLRDQQGETVQLLISGGVLVRKGCERGALSLRAGKVQGGNRITVLLSGYCPLLLGSSTPSPWHKFVYRFTQAYLHKQVSIRFLRALHHELTGQKMRDPAVPVQVREGQIT